MCSRPHETMLVHRGNLYTFDHICMHCQTYVYNYIILITPCTGGNASVCKFVMHDLEEFWIATY